MRLQEKRDFACRMTKFSGCAKNDEKDLIFRNEYAKVYNCCGVIIR